MASAGCLVISKPSVSDGFWLMEFSNFRVFFQVFEVHNFRIFVCFSPTADCYGVSAQYRFRCVLGELGRFREKTGSGKVPGGFRESSGNRSGNRLGSRFQEPVPRFQGLDRLQGSRFQEPVPRLG